MRNRESLTISKNEEPKHLKFQQIINELLATGNEILLKVNE